MWLGPASGRRAAYHARMAATEDRDTAAARGLLERYGAVYGLPDAGPVPVEDIAESLCGLHVRDVPLDAGVSGMLLLQQREIHVNALEAGLWPARRRFTIAHEVGHWELHRDEIEDVTVTRTADYEPAGARERSPEQVREREANRFAAELLMPEPRVHGAVGRDGADVPGLAAAFGVSALSMAWRLYNLGYIKRRPRRDDYDPGL